MISLPFLSPLNFISNLVSITIFYDTTSLSFVSSLMIIISWYDISMEMP